MPRFLLVAVLLAAPAALAQVTANPTRPTFSDNAHPMAEGHFELEFGGAFAHHEQVASPFLFKLGLAEPVEFKVGGEGLRHDGLNDGGFGWGNMAVYTKFRFLDQLEMRPAMAGLVSLSIPTGAPRELRGTVDLGLLWLLTGKFGPMSWDFNTGLDLRGLETDEIEVDIPAILALSATLVGPLGVIMEVADYIPLTGQPNQLYLLGAFTFTITPLVVLDVAFIGGPEEHTPDWQVHVGATITVARLW